MSYPDSRAELTLRISTLSVYESHSETAFSCQQNQKPKPKPKTTPKQLFYESPSKLHQSSIKARGNGKVTCQSVWITEENKPKYFKFICYLCFAAIFSCRSSSKDVTTGLFASPRWSASYVETQREALRDNAEVPGSTPAGQDIIASALRSLSQ